MAIFIYFFSTEDIIEKKNTCRSCENISIFAWSLKYTFSQHQIDFVQLPELLCFVPKVLTNKSIFKETLKYVPF